MNLEQVKKSEQNIKKDRQDAPEDLHKLLDTRPGADYNDKSGENGETK